MTGHLCYSPTNSTDSPHAGYLVHSHPHYLSLQTISRRPLQHSSRSPTVFVPTQRHPSSSSGSLPSFPSPLHNRKAERRIRAGHEIWSQPHRTRLEMSAREMAPRSRTRMLILYLPLRTVSWTVIEIKLQKLINRLNEGEGGSGDGRTSEGVSLT